MPLFPIRDDGGEVIRYDYSTYSAFVGRGLLSYCPDYRFPIHWHDDVELSVIIRGAMDYNVNGQIQTVHEGEGFFISPRQLHSNFSEKHTECEYMCVLVHPLMLGINLDFEKEFVTPLLNGGRMPFYKLTTDVSWHQEICNEIKSIYEEKNERTAPLLIHAHFCNIWAKLYQHLDVSEVSTAKDGNLAIVKAMIRFIQESYQDRITLKKIAAAGAVGESKCCQLFRNYLNMTPNNYLMKYRLDKSRTLLQETELSITQIALDVGFCGASYYAEMFRKWYNETPKEYRERIKGISLLK